MASKQQINLLDRAKKNLSRAKLELAVVEAADADNDLVEAWESFCSLWRDAYTQLSKAVGEGRVKLWGDQLRRAVKDDRALQYVRQTRNASTYTAEAVSETQSRTTNIGIPGLANFVSCREGGHLNMSRNTVVEVDRNGNLLRSHALPDVSIGPGYRNVRLNDGVVWEAPRHLRLLVFVSRGVRYHPPFPELPEHRRSVATGEYAFTWLDERIQEAERRIKITAANKSDLRVDHKQAG